MLEQVTTAANQINALVGCEPDASGNGISESLAAAAGDLWLRPCKRSVEMRV
jgi:hypothetical protein